MRRLVADLHDASRIERGIISINREDCDPSEILKSSVSEIIHDARAKNITITVNEGDLPPLFVDRQRIGQVFSNLLSNAVKYTPSTGQVTVTAEVDEPNRQVHISVADNGRGIPTQDRDKIFKRFFRASNASDDSTDGTGLGLHLARELTRLHEGDLWFEDNPGGGMVFHVKLPFDDRA